MDNNQPQQPTEQPTPQPSMPVTSPPPPHKSKMPLMIIGGIVLLALGLVGGYFLLAPKNTAKQNTNPIAQISPTNTSAKLDETDTWETLSNNTYSFSFQYPKDWIINTPNLGGKHETNKTLLQVNLANTQDFKNTALLTKNKDIISLIFRVWDKTGLSVTDSLGEWDAFIQNPKPSLTSNKRYNNISWTVREITNTSNLPVIEYVTEKAGFLYIITLAPSDSTFIKTADKIISSFTFANQTADWKTYTNTKYKFSVNYPGEWNYLEVPNATYKIPNDQVWFSNSTFPPPNTGARADIVFSIVASDPASSWQPEYFDSYKKENYQLGNISATKITGKNKVGLNQEMVIIAKVGNAYVQIQSNQLDDLKLFDQVLSTFKFTN